LSGPQASLTSLASLRFCAFGALAAWMALATPVEAAEPEIGRATQAPAKRPAADDPIFPLEEVRPGQRGVGWTVFRGTEPEPFEVEVVAVLRKFLPKQDVVLIKVLDERVAFTGVAAGMSGSPIYINGKVMGALAYAWGFAKEPLAGVTPIETMLKDARRPLRTLAPPPTLRTANRSGTSPGTSSGPPSGTAHRALIAQGLAELESMALAHWGPGAQQGALATESDRSLLGPLGLESERGLSGAGVDGTQMRRMALPVGFSGVSADVLQALAADFDRVGLRPVQAGGGGIGSTRKPNLAPGGAVGIQLIDGDMSAAGTGTVTYVTGSTVVAFGHPMMSAGQVALPMTGAEIHHILPSLSSAFKIASPLAPVGTLLQDRPSCVAGRRGVTAPMVPIRISVAVGDEKPEPFRARIAVHDKLTPILATAVAASAVRQAVPEPLDAAVRLSTKIVLAGRKPLIIEEDLFSTMGLSARALTQSRGLRSLSLLMNNPFEPVSLERLEVDAHLHFGRDVARVDGVRLQSHQVQPGEDAVVAVRLAPYGGEPFEHLVRLPIPQRFAGRVLDLEVAGGSAVRRRVATPQTLAQLETALLRFYPASELVVSLSSQEKGAAVQGHLLSGLPPAALDTLMPVQKNGKPEIQALHERKVVAAPRLVFGTAKTKIRVESDPLGARL